MGLKIVRVEAGTRHPRTIWGQFIEGNNEQQLRRMAEQAVEQYEASGRNTYAWFDRNACKVGRELSAPIIGIIWEEFIENEFGLEIP